MMAAAYSELNMSAPEFVSKTNAEVRCEAIQFIQDDPTTHWHVNLGHPFMEAVQGKYWVMTVAGVQLIKDRDWVVKGSDGLTIVDAGQFSSSFSPVPVVGDGQ